MGWCIPYCLVQRSGEDDRVVTWGVEGMGWVDGDAASPSKTEGDRVVTGLDKHSKHNDYLEYHCRPSYGCFPPQPFAFDTKHYTDCSQTHQLHHHVHLQHRPWTYRHINCMSAYIPSRKGRGANVLFECASERASACGC